MNDDVSDIQEWYNNALDSEHERLEQHQLEHDITWCYFERYLPVVQFLKSGPRLGDTHRH